MLDQKCGHRAGKFMLSATRDSTHDVNSRPCRVRSGFSSVQMTISRSHYRNVRELLALGRPPIRIVLLSSTFRRQCIGTKLGVLLASCRHLFYSSALVPTKHLQRPTRNGGQTRVIVMAGYPPSVGPVSCGVVAGELGLFPCRRLCFSSFQCKGLQTIFPSYTAMRREGLSSLRARRRVLLVANVTSPSAVVHRLRVRAQGVSLLTFDSRRGFDRQSLTRVGREFNGLEGKRHLVIAARGSTAHLVYRRRLSRKLGPFVCTLPVRMRVLRGRRSGFGRRVVNCIERGAEGNDLPREGSTRGS